MRTYTRDEVSGLLRSRIGQESPRKFGERLGLSSQFIYMVLGGKCEPGPKLLKFLGLTREKSVTITYFENGKAKK